MANSSQNENDDSSAQSENSEKQEAQSSGTKQVPPPSILAWSIRGICLLLIVGLLGYFGYAALQPSPPPSFKFSVVNDRVEQRSGKWVVPVEVLNEGGMSVHNLQLAATLPGPEAKEQSASIILLGGAETVTVEFWFDEDPKGQRPTFDVKSYLLP